MNRQKKRVAKISIVAFLTTSSIFMPFYLTSCATAAPDKTATVLTSEVVNKIDTLISDALSKLENRDNTAQIKEQIKNEVNQAVKHLDNLEVVNISIWFDDGANNKVATVTVKFNKQINIYDLIDDIQISDEGNSIIIKDILTKIPNDSTSNPPVEPEPDKPVEPNPNPEPEPEVPNPDPEPEVPSPNPEPEPEVPNPDPEPEVPNPEPEKPVEPEQSPNQLNATIINLIDQKMVSWAQTLTLNQYTQIGNPNDTTCAQKITDLKNDINQVLENRTVKDIKFFVDKSKKMGLQGKRVIKVGLTFDKAFDNKTSFSLQNYSYDAVTKMLTTRYVATNIDNIIKDTTDNKYDLQFVANDLEAFIISKIKAAIGTARPKQELDDAFKEIKKVMNNLPVTYAYNDRVAQFGELTYARYTIDFSIKDKFKNFENIFDYVNGKMILKNLDLSDIETNLKTWSEHNNYRISNQAGRMGTAWSMHYQLDPNDPTGNTLEWYLATNLHVASFMFDNFNPTVYGSPQNPKMHYKHKYEIKSENVYLTSPVNGNNHPLLEFKPKQTAQSTPTPDFVAKNLTVYTDAAKERNNGDNLDLFSSSGEHYYNLDFCIFEFDIDITNIKPQIKDYFKYVSSAYNNYLEYTKTHTLRPENPFPLDPPKPVIKTPLNQRVFASGYPQFKPNSLDLYYQYFSTVESQNFTTDYDPGDTEVLESPLLDTETVHLTNGSSGSGIYLIDNLFENMYKKFPIAVFRSRSAPFGTVNPDFTAPQWQYCSHILLGTRYDVYLNFQNLLKIKNTL